MLRFRNLGDGENRAQHHQRRSMTASPQQSRLSLSVTRLNYQTQGSIEVMGLKSPRLKMSTLITTSPSVTLHVEGPVDLSRHGPSSSLQPARYSTGADTRPSSPAGTSRLDTSTDTTFAV